MAAVQGEYPGEAVHRRDGIVTRGTLHDRGNKSMHNGKGAIVAIVRGVRSGDIGVDTPEGEGTHDGHGEQYAEDSEGVMPDGAEDDRPVSRVETGSGGRAGGGIGYGEFYKLNN